MNKDSKLKKQEHKSNIKLQIRYDFFKGTLEEWKKYAVAMMIFAFFCIRLQVGSEKIVSVKINKNIGFADYILFMFRGMNIFSGNAIELQDKLPQWFLINIYLSIIIGYFPLRDLNESGIQVLIRTKSREQWWVSKCLWVIFNVLIYYCIAIIVIMFFAILSGGLQLVPSVELNFILSGLEVGNFTSVQIIVAGLLLPIIASITISLIQLVISLYTNSIISNMVIIILLALTPFYCNSLFIGNYLMVLRSSVCLGSQGVSMVTGIIICLLLSAGIIVLGNYKIKKMDIFHK